MHEKAYGTQRVTDDQKDIDPKVEVKKDAKKEGGESDAWINDSKSPLNGNFKLG